MPLNNTLLNVGVAAMQAVATHAKLYSALPNAAGTTNATSAPRAAITWETAANGDMVLIVDEDFTGGAANGAVQYVGLWSNGVDGTGTYYGELQITSGDVQFNAAGEYTLTAITIVGTAT
jgi:hypothetical protein